VKIITFESIFFEIRKEKEVSLLFLGATFDIKGGKKPKDILVFFFFFESIPLLFFS